MSSSAYLADLPRAPAGVPRLYCFAAIRSYEDEPTLPFFSKWIAQCDTHRLFSYYNDSLLGVRAVFEQELLGHFITNGHHPKNTPIFQKARIPFSSFH
eukprot:6195186-Pleurochrysis_carterae.AAC.1